MLPHLHELNFYSVADAKAHLSRVIDETASGDSIITKNGVPTAVLMDYKKYVRINKFLEQVFDLYLIDVGEKAFDKGILDLIVEIDEE
ncbi:MAG: Prevent-host-death family protein [Thermotogales bacterium 46_20]|nr:MAG: Prevent-host-death family protein [Thermotogales bacterium 46_20]